MSTTASGTLRVRTVTLVGSQRREDLGVVVVVSLPHGHMEACREAYCSHAFKLDCSEKQIFSTWRASETFRLLAFCSRRWNKAKEKCADVHTSLLCRRYLFQTTWRIFINTLYCWFLVPLGIKMTELHQMPLIAFFLM